MNPPRPRVDLSAVTAVILCGGKGERLRPFTESLPKSLVPINGRPLLGYLLDHLARHGIRRFVLCTGYRANEIEAFAAKYAQGKVEIACVDSGDVSMADRVLDARCHIREHALVCYGDTIANVDLQRVVEEHVQANALATVSIYPLRSPFGVVSLLPGTQRVSSLAEKPVLPYWINIGYVLCEAAALDLLERGTDLVSFLRTLAEREGLHAHLHRERHITVNTEKERSAAEQDIEFFTVLGATPS
jgi:NDP-sugar pyrophosphorylase family protein